MDLAKVKLYLRIDQDEEDQLLTDLLATARGYCQDVLRAALPEPLTPELEQAVLYAVARLYEEREKLDARELFLTVRQLLYASRTKEW